MFHRLLAVAAVAATPAFTFADLIAYDPFAAGGSTPAAGQYRTSPASTTGTNNNSLVGQGPALTGFNAGTNWTGGGLGAAVYPAARDAGLTYPGLASVPGHADFFRIPTSTNGGTKTVSRNAVTTDTSAVQWASILLNASTAKEFTVGMLWNPDANRVLNVGFDSTGRGRVIGSGVDNISVVTADPLATNQTHLFLIKLESGVWTDADFANARLYDRLTVWINPDISNGEAGLPAGMVGQAIVRDTVGGGNDNTLNPFRNLSVLASPLAGESFQLDEFRLATTFAEAVGQPIPEPASLGLLALGALALLSRRKA